MPYMSAMALSIICSVWKGAKAGYGLLPISLLTSMRQPAACAVRCLCPVCGAVVRPNVLMFGDWAWLSHRTAEQQLRQSRWMESILGARIAVVEIGAGTAIPSVRRFCHELIQHYQAQLVRINPREFDVPLTQHVGIGMGSLQALQQMHVLM